MQAPAAPGQQSAAAGSQGHGLHARVGRRASCRNSSCDGGHIMSSVLCRSAMSAPSGSAAALPPRLAPAPPAAAAGDDTGRAAAAAPPRAGGEVCSALGPPTAGAWPLRAAVGPPAAGGEGTGRGMPGRSRTGARVTRNVRVAPSDSDAMTGRRPSAVSLSVCGATLSLLSEYLRTPRITCFNCNRRRGSHGCLGGVWAPGRPARKSPAAGRACLQAHKRLTSRLCLPP